MDGLMDVFFEREVGPVYRNRRPFPLRAGALMWKTADAKLDLQVRE